MNITEKIARFIAATSRENMPLSVVEAAKKALLDCMGVTLSGSRDAVGQQIAKFVQETGGKPESVVVGHGFRTSAPWSAFANGAMSHALDYDDGAGLPIPLHPSVCVLPAALALGEAVNATGRQVIEAYIIGIEVLGKIASGIGVEHYFRGFHPTATLGPLGATAAAAKLLNLDVNAICCALGIAASSAGGLRRNFGTMTKPLHAGSAGKNGIVAALLAKQGWTAARDIIEAELGLTRVLAGDGFYDLSKMADHLGDPYHFISPGIKIKLYSCCRAAHTSLDALFELLRRYDVPYTKIQSVECGTDAGAQNILFYHDPQTLLEGKFSLEYCLAVAIIDGQVGLAQFDGERLRDPSIREMMNRVKVFVHPDHADTADSASVITLRLMDGTAFSHRIVRKKSDAPAHMEWGALTAKFRNCAQLAIQPEAVDSLIAALTEIETFENVGTLMEMVR
jgi:2-methylcitrate dehydratase PrpD